MSKNYKNIIVFVGLFLLAFLPRLYFIYIVGNPDNPGAGWFGDAYHHWQIAYLSREIGFKQSFLRLWDLKGMEFFWGLLHPLFVNIAFTLTGSVSIGVERAMTAFFGSISVGLIYIICKKYWNENVAIAASLIAALNPVGIFNDGSGMVEPIGITFLLLAVYLWSKKPLLAGFSFAIALMSRSEYWVFSLFLVIAMIIFTKKKFDNKMLLSIGFAVPSLLYMKYLLDYTGNPIYPLYYNYLTNIFGTWQFKQVLEPQDIFAKYLFIGILIVSVISALLVIKKRPKGMYLYLLGIGNWIFLGATFGLGAYIKSYMTYVWYVRFMIFPYAFLGIVFAVFMFYSLPKIKHLNLLHKFKLNWLITIAVLLATQPTWYLILNKYNSTNKNWENAVSISKQISDKYKGGGLVLVEGNPEITYALIRKFNLKGKDIVSEMFDPYFYFTEDPYSDWPSYRTKVFEWLKKNNVKMIATYSNTPRYAKLSELEPEYISKGEALNGASITIYKVDNEKIKKDF